MSDKLRLGAFDAETKEYTIPSKAVKGRSYICPDCSKAVIFRKGDIRVHHYAHKAETSQCSYYEHPNESQIHKDAKLLMKKLLDDKRLICFTWDCIDCSSFYAFQEVPSFKYEDGDKAILEYRDKDGKWIADVALVNQDKVKCIFEIKYKHKTTTLRPEPWYEVDAISFLKDIYEQFENSEKDPENYSYVNEADYIFDIPCIRKNIDRRCYGSFCYKEYWVRRIPGYDKRNNDNTCISCGVKDYDPVSDGCTGKFQNGEIRVCTSCLYQDIYTNKLRNLYSSDIKHEKTLQWSKKGTINMEYQEVFFNKNEIELLKKIPLLPVKNGVESRWKQFAPCLNCKSYSYSPVFFEKQYYSICKICLVNNSIQIDLTNRLENKKSISLPCLISDE
jgi:hypothetical protein